MQLNLSVLLVLLPALGLAVPTATGDLALAPRQDTTTFSEEPSVPAEPEDMSIMADPCVGSKCPSHGSTIDMVKWVDFLGITNHYIRVKDCGECKRVYTSGDGCINFDMCGKKQEICIDRHSNRMRMHRVNKNTGKKSCYKIKQYESEHKCGANKMSVWAKTDDITCTW